MGAGPEIGPTDPTGRSSGRDHGHFTGYIPPRVTLEFGARSTGEPCEERQITYDAAEHLPDLEFPAAKPRVMLPKRTFWEKATAVHAFCKQGTQGDRLSRHWQRANAKPKGA
jgi:Nucleotidyl transferase AbiEii toxin, Type IV TA system